MAVGSSFSGVWMGMPLQAPPASGAPRRFVARTEPPPGLASEKGAGVGLRPSGGIRRPGTHGSGVAGTASSYALGFFRRRRAAIPPKPVSRSKPPAGTGTAVVDPVTEGLQTAQL